MKVAIVYDRVNKWGGAERVLLALHELFPKAPMYTSVYNPKTASWAKVFRVKTSFLQKIPFASSFHEFFAPFMPLAFSRFSLTKYDVVISVTSEAAKGITVGKNTIHICYCLTPTRYLWSGYKDYFKNRFFKFFSYPMVFILRRWDKKIAQNPDTFIAISQEVKKRIKKYYGKDSVVIYPPTNLFPKQKKSPNGLSGYFLVVSRLVPYKRIDLAIKACNELKLPLVIIGKGREEVKLKKIAGSTIFFVENLTDVELSGYYKNCRALIFPGIEDFGLTIIEAQLYGRPVIAYRGGGAMETIIEGKTGLFFNSQKVDSLLDALKRFEKAKFSPSFVRRQGEKFNAKRFKKELLTVIRKTKKI